MSSHDLQRYISTYTKKISQSEYFNKQNRRFQSDFVALADNLIYMSYVGNYEHHVSAKKPLSEMTMIHRVDESTVNIPSSEYIWTSDTLINFTNISYDFL